MVRILYFFATLSEIQMFYIKYLTMYKVRMHADAIRKLLYDCAHVHTHSPYKEALDDFYGYRDIGQILKAIWDTFINIQSTFRDMVI